MSYKVGAPPAHYSKFTATSPHSSGENIHYAPNYGYSTTPIKGAHRRQASYQASPRPAGGYYDPAGSPPPGDYVRNQPVNRETYVSYERKKSSPPSASKSTSKPFARTRKASNPGPIYVREDDGYVHVLDREPEPTPTAKSKHAKKPSADSYFYFGQEQIREEIPIKRTTRPRRSSTATKSTPQKPRTSVRPAPVATQEDAANAGIPPGYSTKNWDPTELPIILLGSVFDANSFGKWMYDWTVYSCGAETPITDMAGDFWLLLIKLAGKMKRAQAYVRKTRGEDQIILKEFIVSGERLWEKFKDLLHRCEYFMMKAAKKQGSKMMMGKNAGTEFVDSIFGRDRYLESTEHILNGLRVWTMRFDVNCEEIIRHPMGRN